VLLEDIDEKHSIRSRTQNFSIRGITPSEVNWYERMNSREKILSHYALLQREDIENFSLFKVSVVEDHFLDDLDKKAAEKARIAEDVCKLISKRYDIFQLLIMKIIRDFS